MNLATFIVLLIVLAIVGLAIRTIIRDKKSGKGCGGCCACKHEGCQGSAACSHTHKA